MSEWDNVEFYIKEFKLEQWFDLDKIVYSDGTIPGKPAPDIFQIAANRLRLSPEDCVVVEESLLIDALHLLPATITQDHIITHNTSTTEDRSLGR